MAHLRRRLKGERPAEAPDGTTEDSKQPVRSDGNSSLHAIPRDVPPLIDDGATDPHTDSVNLPLTGGGPPPVLVGIGGAETETTTAPELAEPQGSSPESEQITEPPVEIPKMEKIPVEIEDKVKAIPLRKRDGGDLDEEGEEDKSTDEKEAPKEDTPEGTVAEAATTKDTSEVASGVDKEKEIDEETPPKETEATPPEEDAPIHIVPPRPGGDFGEGDPHKAIIPQAGGRPTSFPSTKPEHTSHIDTKVLPATGEDDDGDVVITTCSGVNFLACKMKGDIHAHPIGFAFIMSVLLLCCYRRCREAANRDVAARGEYRAVAAQYEEMLFDNFNDDYSAGADDRSAGSLSENGDVNGHDDDWASAPRKGIELTSIRRQEVSSNGGLTLEEMNG